MGISMTVEGKLFWGDIEFRREEGVISIPKEDTDSLIDDMLKKLGTYGEDRQECQM